jgi:urea transport system permease protein
MPEYWLYVLGAMFIAVTLFLPGGIVGLARHPRLRALFGRKARRDEAEAS